MGSLLNGKTCFTLSADIIVSVKSPYPEALVTCDANGCHLHMDCNGIQELQLTLRDAPYLAPDRDRPFRERPHMLKSLLSEGVMEGCFQVVANQRGRDAWEWEPDNILAHLTAHADHAIILSEGLRSELEAQGISLDVERHLAIECPHNVAYVVHLNGTPFGNDLGSRAMGWMYASHALGRTGRYALAVDPYGLVNKVVFPSLPETSELIPSTYQRCGDCKGSGKYVGLVEVSPCRACGGSGEM